MTIGPDYSGSGMDGRLASGEEMLEAERRQRTKRLAGWAKGRYSLLMAPKSPKPGVRTRDGGEYTCPGCGAVYRVTVYTSPFKDTGHQDCDVCNLPIKSWNHATTWWSYKLTKRSHAG
jgi:hypothetical protein